MAGGKNWLQYSDKVDVPYELSILQCLNTFLLLKIYGLMNECMNEWTNEWTNEYSTSMEMKEELLGEEEGELTFAKLDSDLGIPLGVNTPTDRNPSSWNRLNDINTTWLSFTIFTTLCVHATYVVLHNFFFYHRHFLVDSGLVDTSTDYASHGSRFTTAVMSCKNTFNLNLPHLTQS